MLSRLVVIICNQHSLSIQNNGSFEGRDRHYHQYLSESDITLTDIFQHASYEPNIFVDQGQFSDLDFISGTHQRENVQFANNQFSMLHMEQELIILLENLSSPLVLVGFVLLILKFSMQQFVDHCLLFCSFLFWPLYCLSFLVLAIILFVLSCFGHYIVCPLIYVF